MSSRYRHIVWDWNGTLLDDTEIIIEATNALLERRGLPLMDLDRYRDVFDFPVSVYYAAIGLDLEREPFADLAAEWVVGFEQRWRRAHLANAVPGVLDRLDALGMRHSVLSAAEQSLLLEQTAHFGIAHRFESIVGIDDHHAVSKIDQGKAWLDRVDDAPESILLVGDTTHDGEVAEALGIDAVLVEGGHQSRRRLERTGRPLLASLDALVPFLDARPTI